METVSDMLQTKFVLNTLSNITVVVCLHYLILYCHVKLLEVRTQMSIFMI